MSKRFTQDNTFNGKVIKMEEGMEADCRVLDAIEDSIDRAVSDGAGTMLLYEIVLPRQYAEQNNANDRFKRIQAEICKHQKRRDGSDTTPRYIAVRDSMSDVPVFKVSMFLPEKTSYEKGEFEEKGTCIVHGKIGDWKAYMERNEEAMFERHGLMVKDTVPLDGTKDAKDEAFYVASEMAAMKRHNGERTLFRSKSK